MGAIDLRERGYAGSNASAPNALTPLGAGSEMRQSLGTAPFSSECSESRFSVCCSHLRSTPSSADSARGPCRNHRIRLQGREESGIPAFMEVRRSLD
jgi:hypothetical protein